MPDGVQVKTIMHLRLSLLREPFLCGFIAGGVDLLLVVVFCGGKQKKFSKSLDEKGRNG